jgi:hypothetical protein
LVVATSGDDAFQSAHFVVVELDLARLESGGWSLAWDAPSV